jgi:hypothetical protein
VTDNYSLHCYAWLMEIDSCRNWDLKPFSVQYNFRVACNRSIARETGENMTDWTKAPGEKLTDRLNR